MPHNTKRFFLAFVLSFVALLLSEGAFADPPTRVGRLSYIQGPVSFSPAGVSKKVWVAARINRPLIAGDRLWTSSQSRAELQLGNASLQVKDKTSLRIINLTDHIAQFDVSQGTIILHVRQLNLGQNFEIDTPQLAFRVTKPGDYRIAVNDNGSATTVTVQRGKGIAYAKNAAYKISSPHSYRFIGKDIKHPQFIVLNSQDSFDRWSFERERRVIRARSAQYVSTSMIGYEDLDTYGSWHFVDGYGYAWTPYHVPSGWAPYRYGHWSWVNPWGWTWIDDEAWGFAPSHYGRWAYHHHTWIWIPGPRTVLSSYAPAVVAFVGDHDHHANVAWFPLGPHDVYIPPYKVSEQYFVNINVNNTTINHVKITNIYNHPTSQTIYSNHRVTNAITVIPAKSFVQSESAANVVVPVAPTTVSQAPVSATAPVVPDQTSVTGPQTGSTSDKPSDSTLDRVPVVVTPPPTPTAPLSEQKKKIGRESR